MSKTSQGRGLFYPLHDQPADRARQGLGDAGPAGPPVPQPLQLLPLDVVSSIVMEPGRGRIGDFFFGLVMIMRRPREFVVTSLTIDTDMSSLV